MRIKFSIIAIISVSSLFSQDIIHSNINNSLWQLDPSAISLHGAIIKFGLNHKQSFVHSSSHQNFQFQSAHLSIDIGKAER